MSMNNLSDTELAAIHASGTTQAKMVTVKMKSEHYAIFHWPGCYWYDNGGRHYGPSSHVLQLKGVCKYGGRPDAVQEWEGRVSKKVLEKALADAESKYQGKDETK